MSKMADLAAVQALLAELILQVHNASWQTTVCNSVLELRRDVSSLCACNQAACSCRQQSATALHSSVSLCQWTCLRK